MENKVSPINEQVIGENIDKQTATLISQALIGLEDPLELVSSTEVTIKEDADGKPSGLNPRTALIEERRRAVLVQSKSLSPFELAATLGVSTQTVRNDQAWLIEQNLLEKPEIKYSRWTGRLKNPKVKARREEIKSLLDSGKTLNEVYDILLKKYIKSTLQSDISQMKKEGVLDKSVRRKRPKKNINRKEKKDKQKNTRIWSKKQVEQIVDLIYGGSKMLEVAKLFNTTEGAIKSLLHRKRQKTKIPYKHPIDEDLELVLMLDRGDSEEFISKKLDLTVIELKTKIQRLRRRGQLPLEVQETGDVVFWRRIAVAELWNQGVRAVEISKRYNETRKTIEHDLEVLRTQQEDAPRPILIPHNRGGGLKD